MKPHKWAKEIKAWADGAEVEYNRGDGTWLNVVEPLWHNNVEYRIKPTPKEPQYLYVFDNGYKKHFSSTRYGCIIRTDSPNELYKYIGKIKLEQDNE